MVASFATLKSGTPPPVSIAPGEVHIWRVRLDRDRSEVRRAAALLAADERGRAERILFDWDRARYLVGRATLRFLLARYSDSDPRGLRFDYGPRGKPRLADACGIAFNLSHSQGLGLVAVARDREIGIDLERIRRDVDYERIAALFFSLREQERLQAIAAPELRLRAFFACWTRKEAYLKARGEGLSFPLDRFDVSIAPSESAPLLEDRGDLGKVVCWSLRDVSPDPDHAAAVAVEGDGWRLVDAE